MSKLFLLNTDVRRALFSPTNIITSGHNRFPIGRKNGTRTFYDREWDNRKHLKDPEIDPQLAAQNQANAKLSSFTNYNSVVNSPVRKLTPEELEKMGVVPSDDEKECVMGVKVGNQKVGNQQVFLLGTYGLTMEFNRDHVTVHRKSKEEERLVVAPLLKCPLPTVVAGIFSLPESAPRGLISDNTSSLYCVPHSSPSERGRFFPFDPVSLSALRREEPISFRLGISIEAINAKDVYDLSMVMQ